jgi:hypothetical protein
MNAARPPVLCQNLDDQAGELLARTEQENIFNRSEPFSCSNAFCILSFEIRLMVVPPTLACNKPMLQATNTLGRGSRNCPTNA